MPMSFVPSIEIKSSAYRQNLALVRQLAPHSNIMAVIKSDAYGHGMLAAADALHEADAFAVARTDEGVRLIRHGVNLPVLVLAGAQDADELALARRHQLQLVVQNPEQLELIQAAGSIGDLRCWVKLDTGMNRLGFNSALLPEVLARLNCLDESVRLEGIMTHLADADNLDSRYTPMQLERFQRSMQGQAGMTRSVANSAAIIGWPETRLEWVRPGIMLYGISPFGAPLPGLTPVMTFKARVIALKQVQKGDKVGYGCTWEAPARQTIGVVAVGYGDGYPRRAPQGTPVLIRGRKVPLVGRVSMDTLTLDLSRHPQVQVGDEVILWGDGLPVETIAQAAGTIPYVLTCGITARVQKRILP